ncbi:MAG: class I SAM-dependent RNA methyltransferase, partial [Gemmatimonadetes bacterium]|nr:class I SAM-dependent RNA methyltransferase [Gemmatimonadota bacterium]
NAKQDIVRQALSRIGHRAVEVEPVRPSPGTWRYRNKLTLTLRGRGAGRHGGLRRLGSPDAVFDLRECLVAAKPIELAWGEVRSALALLPVGDDVRVVLRAEASGVSLVVKGGGPWGDRDAFLARCPSLTRVRHDRSASAPTDDDDAVASLDAFAQVNDAMAREMEDHVVLAIRETSPARVVDAYGGQGRIAGRLSAAGIAVSLIEFDPEATRVAAAEHPAVDVRTARVEDAIADVLPADVVLVNPPRTGLHARVCEVLEGATPRPDRLIYVSCDPATLARDLGRLPSWRVERVTPFDLFPQTAHVETVCVLSPEVMS